MRSCGGEPLRPVGELFEVVGSRAHGHVQAVCVAMHRLGFPQLLSARAQPERERVCAMVAARVLAPHTKLATTRWWHTTTLAEHFGVAQATRTICMRRWTGWLRVKAASRRSSRRAT